MSIGPRQVRATFAALALALGFTACGSSLTTPIPESKYVIHTRVPTNAHLLTVSRGFPGHRPSLSFTTADAMKVRKVASMFDRLHPVRPGIVNCPMIRSAPTVIFAFRAQRGRPVLARASTLATGPNGECPGVTFKAHGHPAEVLSARPAFLQHLQRVLGVTLMTK